MAIPTDLEIESAVPTDGTPPSRALVQALLKAIRDELGGSFPLPLTDTTGANEFRAQIDLINTQAVDTASGNLRLAGGGSGPAFTDWSGALIEDHIFNLGLNFGYGDSTFRQDVTKPSFGVAWESKYWGPGKRQMYATEFGFRGRTQGGNERRLMDCYLPWDGLDYDVVWNAAVVNWGHPVTSKGAMGFQRVKFDFWPNNLIRLLPIAATGTAAGATTNAAGYAAGVSQVTLAAAGTGALPVDCIFQFDGAGTYYAVEEAVANVSGGGTLKFSPALTSALSAATHTIVRATVPAPYIVSDTNNRPMLWQRNAAGTADLGMWYYNANDALTLPQGRVISPNAAGVPLQIKANASQESAILDIIASDNASLVSFGGYASNNSGDGRGWVLVKAKDTTAGFETRHLLGGRNIAGLFYTEGNSGYSDVVLRHAAWGTGSTTGRLRFQVEQTTSRIDFGVWPGTNWFSLLAARADFQIPAGLKSYATVAALPSASASGVGALAHVAATTTPGGACVVCSDGTNWKVVVALSGAATVA